MDDYKYLEISMLELEYRIMIALEKIAKSLENIEEAFKGKEADEFVGECETCKHKDVRLYDEPCNTCNHNEGKWNRYEAYVPDCQWK